MSHTPPPVLDHGRVLEYAVLNDRVEYSGHSLLFVDGKEVGPVPRIAICQSLNNPDIVLLHCDNDWNVLGAGIFNSAGEAKSRAEKTYPGVATCWIKSHFTNEQVSKHLEEIWNGLHCVFCGKMPYEVERLIEKSGVGICDSCIEELYQMLREDPEGPKK
jgi:hypothetical protein